MTEGTQPPPPSRFMKMDDVAAKLNTTQAQVYALVRNGSIAAIKIGGRGQWRVERTRLEEFIANAYDETARFVADPPSGGTTTTTLMLQTPSRPRGGLPR